MKIAKTFLTVLCLPAILAFSSEVEIANSNEMEIANSESVKEAQQNDLNYLNKQIESLSGLRDYYLAKAARLKNRASRYEFQSGGANYPEAQRLFAQAEEYTEISKKIDNEIQILKRQRKVLEKQMQKSD